MKGKFVDFLYLALSTLALVVVFVCLSPAAYADHSGHSEWTAISASSKTNLSTGSYYLREDITGDVTITGDVKLCLNGHSITGSGSASVITISKGASLELDDCGKAGKISGGKATEGGGICVMDNASLVMTGGTVTGNEATRGGGIFAAASAQLSLSDCTLADNFGKTGGGLFLRCDAELTNLTITGNSSDYKGAGVYAESVSDCQIYMSGCSVDNNIAGSHGGGIYIEACVLTVEDSSISSNEVTAAHACGGGVYVGEHADFIMNQDVTISDNTAVVEGGGVCLSGGSYGCNFIMNGGSISGNTADAGGGISTTGAGVFRINGGSISGNTAVTSGGGVYISFSYTRDVEKYISGCDIYNNTASDYGGGIYYQGNSFIGLTIDNSKLRRNTALDGGGVYVDSEGTLTLSGVTAISKNTSNGRGPNLYLHSTSTMSVADLEQSSVVGLSLEYTEKSVFTTDAKPNNETLKNCFVSDLDGFGISIADNKELQIALSCRVDFNTNGGTLDETYKIYTTGDPLGELPVPQKDGYTFTYWDYNGRKVSESDAVTFDKTLNANYEFNKYTVKYDANGGYGTMASQACRYTVPFTLSTCTFKHSSLVFLGWSLTPDGSVEYQDGARAGSLCKTANGTVTLYAQWGVAKADAISVPESLSLSIGETGALSVTAQPADADISDITWTSSNEKYATVDESGRITALAAGKTTITATTTKGVTASCELEVGRRALSAADFSFSQQRSFAYDGTAHAPVLDSYPEGTAPTITYTRVSDNTALKAAPTEVGSYSISISVPESTSYAATDNITSGSWSFTIEAGEQQPLEIVNVPDDISYGQAFTLSTAGGSGDGVVTWELTEGDCAVVNDKTGDIYISGRGSFTVTAVKAASEQYLAASTSVTLTVSRQQLYLETQPTVVTEKIYDGSDLAQLIDMGTIGGYAAEDAAYISIQASARFEDKGVGLDKIIVVSYSLSAGGEIYQAPEDVYIEGGAIYPKAVELSWSYSEPLTYNCGTQSVRAYVTNAVEGDTVTCIAYDSNIAADAGDYYATVTELDNYNYTLEGAEGNGLYWSIQPRTLNIKADDLEKTYSLEDPVFSYTSTDAILPELTGTLSRDAGEDVGSYYIHQGSLALADTSLAGNYTISFTEGVLTIEVTKNSIYNFTCNDIPYGGDPAPYADSVFGYAQFTYSKEPDGEFTAWDNDNEPGMWYVKAKTEGTYNYTEAEAVMAFTVLKEEIYYFAALDTPTVSGSGDVLSNIAAVLPTELDIVNNRYLISQHKAQVWWKIEKCDYDASIEGVQLVTVTGEAVLPDAINNYRNVSLNVSIQICVNPYLTVTDSAASTGQTKQSDQTAAAKADPFL